MLQMPAWRSAVRQILVKPLLVTPERSCDIGAYELQDGSSVSREVLRPLLGWMHLYPAEHPDTRRKERLSCT